MIQFERVSFGYTDHKIFNQIDFHAEKGSLCVLTGHNGSGKTTFLKLAVGLLKPQLGKIIYSCKKSSIMTGMAGIIEAPQFFCHMSGRENIEYFLGNEYRRSLVDRMIELFELHENYDKKVSDYSLGMRQKLALAMVFASETDLIVLDEPTNSLDGKGICEFNNVIKESVDRGKTVLIAIHNLQHVDNNISKRYEIKDGRLVILQ